MPGSQANVRSYKRKDTQCVIHYIFHPMYLSKKLYGSKGKVRDWQQTISSHYNETALTSITALYVCSNVYIQPTLPFSRKIISFNCVNNDCPVSVTMPEVKLYCTVAEGCTFTTMTVMFLLLYNVFKQQFKHGNS